MPYLLCLFVPPLAVLNAGRPDAARLNLLLTLCFWVPGVVHALLTVRRADTVERNQKLGQAQGEVSAVIFGTETAPARKARTLWSEIHSG